MSKHAVDCFAEILGCFVDGEIESIEDLETILEDWDFVDEDNELTKRGQQMFVGEDEDSIGD